MPTVPFDPSVDLSANPMGRFAAPDVAAPAVQQGPDYTGKQIEQTGAAMVNAGSTFMRIAERIQDDVDDANTKKFDNQTAEFFRAKKTEYLMTKGQDAIKKYAAVDEEMSRYVASQMDNLDNEMQRKMFGNVAQKRLLAARAEMGAHQLKELNTWNLNETKDTAKNFLLDAIADADNYKTPNSTFNERKSAMLVSVNKIAQLEGIVNDQGNVDTNSAQYKALVRDYNTTLHTSVLNSAINNEQLDFAREYLKTFRGEIAADKLNQIDKALDVGTFDAKTQGFAQKFWLESKGDLAGALSIAREKLSGKEEDATVQRLKMFAQEQEAIKTLEKSKLGNEAWGFVLQGRRIPTTLETTLMDKNPEELRQIRDWIDTKRRQAKAEAEQGGNYGLDQYYSLRRMAMDDPSAFISLDLRKFAPYMSKGQMEGLIDIQGGINKNDVKAMESQRVIKNTIGLIKSDVAAAGIDLTPKEGTPQAKQTQQFMGALTQALDQATKEKGRPLTDEEAKRIGMSMLRVGFEQGKFFPSKKRGYEIATDPNINPETNFIIAKYDDIPVKIRQDLLRSYVDVNPGKLQFNQRTQKYILTDEAMAEIERKYTKGVEQGRFK